MNINELLAPQWAGFNNEELDGQVPQAQGESTIFRASDAKNQDNGDRQSDSGTENDVEPNSESDGESDHSSDSDYKNEDESDSESDGESDHSSEDEFDSDDDEESDEEDSSSIEQIGRTEAIQQNSPFFTLPCELRLMIYGHLLRADGMIYDKNHNQERNDFFAYIPNANGRDLHPQILATCRQINSECGNMLYDDNTFHVTIADFDRQFHQYWTSMSLPLIFQRMRRIELKVENARCQHYLAYAIETTGRVLSQMPKLKQVSINITKEIARTNGADVDSDKFSKTNVHRSQLQGLTMTRNVQQAAVEGVAPSWEKYLIEKMTSSSSIPKMYYALERYVKLIDGPDYALKRQDERNIIFIDIQLALEWAYRAAGRDNLQKFLKERKMVLELVDEYIKETKQH